MNTLKCTVLQKFQQVAFRAGMAGLLLTTVADLGAQSLDIPTHRYGLSIGNSKHFNGLRINFRDKQVEEINGINLTLWRASENENATVRGLSFGLLPEAGTLKGIHGGLLGVAAENHIDGISFGLLGAGAGGSITGITLGGLGAGSGGSMTGLMFGGLGAGAAGDVTGIAIGGLGVGSGGDLKGIAMGIMGAGAAGDVNGIMLGGFGVGSGGNMTGFAFGGLGAGCAKTMTGLFIGGVGVGSGEYLRGVALGGVGAGAPKISGIAAGGIGVGANEITGITLTLGRMKVESGGAFKGLAIGSWNHVAGQQTGVSLGIFNYACELKGIQLGVINVVRENPRYLRILPLINF